MDNGTKNYIIPVSNGIIEHHKQIGSAIWLFILLIDWVTIEENGVGRVWGGKPVKAKDIMQSLDLKARQVGSQLTRLKVGGYIRLKRTPYGYSIDVLKSKKFINRDTQKTADLDTRKSADHSGEIRSFVRNRYAVLCGNKEDLTLDKERGTESDKPIPDSLSLNSSPDSKKRKHARAPALADPRVQPFLTWFAEEFERRHRQPYTINGGKEGKLIKSLPSGFDLAKLKSLAKRFFESDDSWIREKGGFTIGVFVSQINKLSSTADANGYADSQDPEWRRRTFANV